MRMGQKAPISGQAGGGIDLTATLWALGDDLCGHLVCLDREMCRS